MKLMENAPECNLSIFSQERQRMLAIVRASSSPAPWLQLRDNTAQFQRAFLSYWKEARCQFGVLWCVERT